MGRSHLAWMLFVVGSIAQAQPAEIPPRVVFKGHTDPVYTVALHPTAPMLATGSFDKTVKLWDSTTGQNLRTLTGHTGLLLSVAFSPDGQRLASGATDNTARVWDVPLTMPTKELPAGSPVTAFAVSPDGKTFAVGTRDGKLRMWSLTDPKPTFEKPAHVGPVLAAAYTPNGSALLTVGADRRLRYWAPTGVSFGDVGTGPSDVIGLMTLGPAAVTTHADGYNRLWPLALPTGIPRIIVPKKSPEPTARGPAVVLPNTNSFYTPTETNQLLRWNVTSAGKEQPLDVGGPMATVAISRDGQRLAAVGSDGTVRLFATNNGQSLGAFKPATGPKRVLFHPTLPILIGVNGATVTAYSIPVTPGQPAPADLGRISQSFRHPTDVTAVAFTGDANPQMITAVEDGRLRFWKVASEQPMHQFPHPNMVDCVAFHPTEGKLATACHDGIVRIFDVIKGGGPIKDIKAHVAMPVPHPVYAVVWSPDGKVLASASFDKSIKLWDAATGNLVREIKGAPDAPPAADKPAPVGHRDQVLCLAFTTDGKRLASGSSDRMLKLWDVATGNLIRDFPNPNLKSAKGDAVPSHPGFVHAVRFHPDGQTLVSVGTAPRNAGYLAVWGLDGKLRSASELPFGPIYSLDHTADGATLFLGCGPKSRTASESEAVSVGTPGR